MKPGYKTTEFYITLAIQILGLLATLGVFTQAQADILGDVTTQLVGLIVMAFSAFGYSLARGKAKSSAASDSPVSTWYSLPQKITTAENMQNDIGFIRMRILAMIFGLCLLLSMVGCAWIKAIQSGDIPEATGICAGPTQYIDRVGILQTMEDPLQTALCKIDPYWDETEIGMLAVNTIALEKEWYKAADVNRVVERLKIKVDEPNMSIGTLAGEAIAVIGQSPGLFILKKGIEKFIPYDYAIDDFSAYFIKKHLDDQNAIAAMYQ